MNFKKFELNEHTMTWYHVIVQVAMFIALVFYVEPFVWPFSKYIVTMLMILPVQLYSRYFIILYVRGYRKYLYIPFYPYYMAWFHPEVFDGIEIEWAGPSMDLVAKEMKKELLASIIIIILFLIFGI